MMTDPVADMLTRLRNASKAKHTTTEMPVSKLKRQIAQLLKEEGYIQDFEVLTDTPHGALRVHLKYTEDRTPAFAGLRRVSKPGLRVYRGRQEIPRVLGGLGTVILSTPKGLMTGRQAWRQNVGGEILAYVW
jgi:small subunit ribosomal protein S8